MDHDIEKENLSMDEVHHALRERHLQEDRVVKTLVVFVSCLVTFIILYLATHVVGV
jgi:prolyl-tRNA editing enzyme YbaK/EbsC (Cys-tRNA(Pro) deacylase)